MAAALHDERSALAAALYGTPGTGGTGRPRGATPAAGQLDRAGRIVPHLVAAPYEQALPLPGRRGGHPLAPLVEDASPILQCMRFAAELMAARSDIPTRKAQTR
jgi:hypothetical protein